MVDGHPIALRERAVAAYEAGRGSYPEIGELFGVGEASVKRWVWRKRKLGHVESKGVTNRDDAVRKRKAANQARMADEAIPLGDAAANVRRSLASDC